MKPRVLCVDDEPAVLEAIQRNFRREFDVIVETSGASALERLNDPTPFAVIVSDMRMPSMDGATFLAKARAKAPETVRVLLTGQADLSSAMAAVNEGHVFRFLTKPCEAPSLLKALQASVQQYELVRAERVLLEQTLRGSIQALSDVLALVSPESFGRANRVKETARDLAKKVGASELWSLDVAAMLSELGCIVLPPEVAAKAYRGQTLAPDEQAMVERTPAVLERILSGIPRLDSVRSALKYQDKAFDGSGRPDDRVSGNEIPIHARLLKVSRDYDSALSAKGVAAHAVAVLARSEQVYDPAILAALVELRGSVGMENGVLQLPLESIEPGMKLVTDVRSAAGVLLVARGQTVTKETLERLNNLSGRITIVQPIGCTLPAG
jgi:response regulator RpfG family c-di-GMP phosphodiesterase